MGEGSSESKNNILDDTALETIKEDEEVLDTQKQSTTKVAEDLFFQVTFLTPSEMDSSLNACSKIDSEAHMYIYYVYSYFFLHTYYLFR